MRQSPDVMLSVLQAHLVSKKQVNEHPLWPRGANTVQQLMRQHTRDKLDFIILIMAIAHSKDERCGRLLSSPSSSTVEQRTPPSPPASEGLTCGPTSAFDVRSLPYRWLPGLPYPRTTLKEGQTAGRRRFEVMHIADYWPGPMWLYHAPGSGVWWDPGPRVIVARNLVDAVLKFKTMKEIISHLNWVERGDRRVPSEHARRDESGEAERREIAHAPFAVDQEVEGAQERDHQRSAKWRAQARQPAEGLRRRHANYSG
jgi:hypothetical protein